MEVLQAIVFSQLAALIVFPFGTIESERTMISNFKRIMVGLDFTSMDQTILEYVKMIKDVFQPSVIYFVHSEDDLDVPNELLEEHGDDVFKPNDENLKEKLEASVAEHIQSDDQTEIVCQVVEGSALKEMLHWSHIKNVDLLVVGKKTRESGKGVLPQKLTRKIGASVLFIPETYKVKPIEKILLPVDMSKKSKLAIDTAVSLFGDKGVELIGANCYSLPLGWHKSGKSEEEFSARMRELAEKKYHEAFDGYDHDATLNFSSCFCLDNNDEPSEEIVQMANEHKVDLIMIGARGKSDIAAIILGSTTEKLLVHDDNIPLFVLKKKGETIGFLEALFKMK